MSKTYGVPGVRIGWLVSSSIILQGTFLAAKEQISISGSVLDNLVAELNLSCRAEILSPIVVDMKRRRDLIAGWDEKESDSADWVRPEAGVVCFVKVKKEPPGGTKALYNRLLREYGVYIGGGGRFFLILVGLCVADVGGTGNWAECHFKGASGGICSLCYFLGLACALTTVTGGSFPPIIKGRQKEYLMTWIYGGQRREFSNISTKSRASTQ